MVSHNRIRIMLALIAGITASSNSLANTNIDFSGFGTLGYAVSDKSYHYLKYVNNESTFYKDSILGGQLDYQFNSQLSATVQLILAADESDDESWAGDLAWAFISYRPTNDWLVRAGKLRIPGYLNASNRDIGVTYDYVRIPVEFDSISPTYDFTGLALNKSFFLPEGDLLFDLYYGFACADWRVYTNYAIPGESDIGSTYMDVEIDVVGSAVTYQTLDNIFVASLHYAEVSNKSDTQWVDEAYVNDYGGYYSTLESEGAKYDDTLYIYFATLGTDIDLGNEFRLASELATRQNSGNGLEAYTGYVSLRKRIGNWTPYIFYSQIKTDSENLSHYQSLTNVSTGNPSIDALQKVLADSYMGYDQYSVAIGTSYNVSPTSKLKAEIMISHINSKSSLVDEPDEKDISNTDIGVLSISYSFLF